MITTEAWVLYRGQRSERRNGIAQLKKENYAFPDITEDEVLAEPIYGCWEGNMTHAIRRDPIDICHERGEERIIIGNAGVVRILKTGRSATGIKEGDLCIVFCNGIPDRLGYPGRIYGYDAPGTIGLLAKRLKLKTYQIIPIPEKTRYSLQQWAAFSLRYITAWANWKVAYGCWQLLLSGEDPPAPFVWGWGGGVTLAEVSLARLSGCRTAMISSNEERLQFIRRLGIEPIDRRQFRDLNFDSQRYYSDPAFKKAYKDSENRFVNMVKEQTLGLGVAVFIDFIGLPVFRATLKALSRPGVITTAGWKGGMNLSSVRAIECMRWHIHVHTHYARYSDGLEAIRFAESSGWMTHVEDQIYGWDCIPQLAQDHADGRISSYFPVFQVNPL
jgi:NADPH:quinone reductase-like Zn-dependent oxidoreductase